MYEQVYARYVSSRLQDLTFPGLYPLQKAQRSSKSFHNIEQPIRVYSARKIVEKFKNDADEIQLYACDIAFSKEKSNMFHPNEIINLEASRLPIARECYVTVLCLAIAHNDEKLLQIMLLDSEIDVNLRSIYDSKSRFIMTPLELLIGMAWYGYSEFAEKWIPKLIVRGAKMIVHHRFYMGAHGPDRMYLKHSARQKYNIKDSLDLMHHLRLDTFCQNENKTLKEFISLCDCRNSSLEEDDLW